MTSPSATPPQPEQHRRYEFLLFVADGERNSALARENLDRICRDRLAGRYRVQVIDVVQEYQKAMEYGVLVTPTLIMHEPRPGATVVGNLGDAGKVCAALGLGE